MIINLKHKLFNQSISLLTKDDSRDTRHEPSVNVENTETGEYLKQLLRKEINNSYGHYGHINDFASITNLDLLIACKNLPSFEFTGAIPEELKGEPLPDDVFS